MGNGNCIRVEPVVLGVVTVSAGRNVYGPVAVQTLPYTSLRWPTFISIWRSWPISRSQPPESQPLQESSGESAERMYSPGCTASNR
jgi:hypothetical protein